VRLAGADLVLRRAGEGPTLLYLHGEDGLLFTGPLLERLSERFSVVAPHHPGWGSPRPKEIRSLDDIAYLYLDLLAWLADDCVVLGTSLGGWLAAEIATKSTAGIRALVLAAPVGIKTTGRQERTFVDIWATAPQELKRVLYTDPELAPDLSHFGDDELLELALAQEATARYGWEPYLFNPSLRHRLHRIDVPTVVVAPGEERFVLDPGYYDAFAAAIGDNARVVTVPGVGHRVEELAPAELAAVVAELAAPTSGAMAAGRS